MGIPLVQRHRVPPHPSDDILEDYAFRRLPEELLTSVEEHLLICHLCQDAVAETDQFAAAMKSAAIQPIPWWRPLPSFAARTTLAPAVALVVLLLAMVLKYPQAASPPVAMSLTSLRGISPLADAPAGRTLKLAIEVPDVVPTGEYSVEVVNAAGRSVWKGPAENTGGKLVATMSKPLGNGVYWVRLYGKGAELLREFGLSAK